ncbi:YfbU family protein [Inquilinus limosus]|uniref:YfbU family protein n=1 Tax=Inquilinus limosus TaxID=171674 RepID=UPI003F175C3E
MKITDGEKLILAMLCEIYKHLKVDGDIDPNFVQNAIYGGHYWGLEWKYEGILHGHEDKKEHVKEVVDILDMWSFLESSYSALSAEDKKRVETEAAPFGVDVKFLGFDGNNEHEHMAIAHFLINDLDRFSSFERRGLNSHMRTLDMYRRMYSIFEPIRSSLHSRNLNANEIIEILKAKKHS